MNLSLLVFNFGYHFLFSDLIDLDFILEEDHFLL